MTDPNEEFFKEADENMDKLKKILQKEHLTDRPEDQDYWVSKYYVAMVKIMEKTGKTEEENLLNRIERFENLKSPN